MDAVIQLLPRSANRADFSQLDEDSSKKFSQTLEFQIGSDMGLGGARGVQRDDTVEAQDSSVQHHHQRVYEDEPHFPSFTGRHSQQMSSYEVLLI